MPRSISPSELQLKARVLNELRRLKRIRHSTVLANELPLGSTGVRADLALHSRRFLGVEVKSNRDSLKRLKHQLPVYQAYFDKTLLVCGSRHLDELQKIDLDRVEVWIASGLSLRRLDANGSTSPAPTSSVSYSTKAPHRKALIADFRKRFMLTSKTFWCHVQDRPIEEGDLAVLSRFIEKRTQAAAAVKRGERTQDEWMKELAQSIQSSSVFKKESSS